MKISKVDNARIASLQENKVVFGKLYFDPKNKYNITLENHIRKRINQSKGLYNVLNIENEAIKKYLAKIRILNL